MEQWNHRYHWYRWYRDSPRGIHEAMKHIRVWKAEAVFSSSSKDRRSCEIGGKAAAILELNQKTQQENTEERSGRRQSGMIGRTRKRNRKAIQKRNSNKPVAADKCSCLLSLHVSENCGLERERCSFLQSTLLVCCGMLFLQLCSFLFLSAFMFCVFDSVGKSQQLFHPIRGPFVFCCSVVQEAGKAPSGIPCLVFSNIPILLVLSMLVIPSLHKRLVRKGLLSVTFSFSFDCEAFVFLFFSLFFTPTRKTILRISTVIYTKAMGDRRVRWERWETDCAVKRKCGIQI